MRLVRRKQRKSDGCGKLELERVIGLTTANPNGLACNGVSEELAYIAGCVIVVYNARTNCQTRFLMSQGSPKPFSCVAFSSQGGKFIAAGESGHQPAVLVWEVATLTCIAEMKTHKYGVSCVQFSPNGKHLISLGLPHDGYMCLWDWKSGTLLMKTRAASGSLVASTVQFATDGTYFVSGGAKHLKQWTIGGPRARSSSGMTTNPGMDGRPVKLGSQRESVFVSLSSAATLREQNAGAPTNQPIYALTSSGVLCLLYSGLAVEKWVDLQVRQAYALAASEGYVACACSDGIVRIFLQGSLEYSATLPRPAPHGYHGLTDANVGAYLAVGNRVTDGIKFPDAIACCYLQQGQNIAVIYADHSLYVWDVRSYSKIGRYRTFLPHSSCIWDVVSLPDRFHSTCVNNMPRGESFATCSADGSIRLWHLDLGHDDTANGSPIHLLSGNARPQNVYNKDILGVLYIDTLGEHKGRLSTSGAGEEAVDTNVGFRSISVSPDGNHLAAGDSSGNLRIFDLNSLLLHRFQEAHDAEILSLGYTTIVSENNPCDADLSSKVLLASGGRDRLIHVYDVNRGYDVVETLDDHTASITTVRFACNGSKLLSCSADKSVVFRDVAMTMAGCKASRYHQEIATRGTIYDMDIDASDKLVVTVGQEKKLNILSLVTGKPVRCFKPEGDVGEPIKVRMDPSGAYVVCSHSDRCMRIYNFITGEPLAEASGHAEVITGVTFLPDCRRLISVSGDSCIFVWRLPINLSRVMRKRCSITTDPRPPLKTLKSSVPRSNLKDIPRAAKIPRVHQMKGDAVDGTNENLCPDLEENQADPDGKKRHSVGAPRKEMEGSAVGEVTPAAFKFSVSRLPPWAQAKIARDEAPPSGGEEPNTTENSNKALQSRWTERLGRDGYKLFSEFMEESTPPATIRPSGFGAKRRFSVEGASVACSDSTPESAASQLPSSPASSPSLVPRKETHWTSVHTVFLDDSDFDDISPPTVALPHDSQTHAQTTERKASSRVVVGNHQSEATDAAKGSPSDDEGEPDDFKRGSEAEDIVYYTPGSAGVEVQSGKKTLFKVSSKDKNEVIEDYHLAPTSQTDLTKTNGEIHGDEKILAREDSGKLYFESEEDELVEDDSFSPCRDLFSAHFDKLASDPKVEGSVRRSFSARFFAQSNPKLSRSSSSPSSLPESGKENGGNVVVSMDGSVSSESDLEKKSLSKEELVQLHEEEVDYAEVLIKKATSVNLDNADSSTASHALQADKNVTMEGVHERSEHLQAEGSSQMPDLLASRSPQLKHERGERLSLKFKSKTPIPSLAPALSPLSPKLQDEALEKMVFDCSERSIYRLRREAQQNRTQDEPIFGITKVENATNDSLKSLIYEVPTAPTAAELQDSGDTIFLQAVDGVVKHSRPVIRTICERDFQSEDKLCDEKRVSPPSTDAGEVAIPSDIEPCHSSQWEVYNTRRSTMKALPRPVEDYQKALKELMDAASKASLLFDEVYSFCYQSNPTGSRLDSVNIPTSSLPPDVVRSGQAYQRLAPVSLQVMQKLAEKVSACSFPSDSSDGLNPSDNVPIYDFSFHKSADHGDNGRQSWRASGASIDSVLSSVDMENFISRYSENLASQVLALVQKSLATSAPS